MATDAFSRGHQRHSADAAKHHVDNAGSRWRNLLNKHARLVQSVDTWARQGRITRATGLVLEATGLRLAVGAACRIDMSADGNHWTEADVVGFHGQTLFLMPQGDISGLTPGAPVVPGASSAGSNHEGNQVSCPGNLTAQPRRLPVGDALLGRVVDGAGNPLDGLGDLIGLETSSLIAPRLNPFDRQPIDTVLDVGVCAINGLLTIGRGQRLGLFAGSGVGKSVLLGMLARYTQADVIVVGLIGERSREVKEFIDHNLGPAGLSRAVVVVAPASVSPLLRLQAATYATRLAEYFRDQGHHVLLIMDSLTRYAMAQREVALAIGEPPATKGYPPSVFARIPALIERAGNGASTAGLPPGSITAFYTVLTEGDDQQDPIADAARSILDGHIVLSRSLAEAGHYPAIDIEASISRVMTAIVPPEQLAQAQYFKRLISCYQRNKDLIAVGAYASGNDPFLDQAIARYTDLETYLRQNTTARTSYQEAVESLHNLLGGSSPVPGDIHQ
ncbi:FliI/YscN family ATPase [Allopusillimonas ginsengisoli]|uniref:FliI/YscN family ATPase n=1 Tax=Allopusillimonas ginsengisoli TaxID=453575 RepID=UPI00101FEAFE|nr:FliI/YscN family ATPase [Allopusillimonas ginsengisoli]TEA79397.1 FliI/YscN family ATPase [Allopusillimonas ginsengisoli]